MPTREPKDNGSQKEMVKEAQIQSTCYIRRLTIERFRGIKSLTWIPGPGTNIILGGGDVGKTTILDSIALLLSPTNFKSISDSDYWHRDTDAEFIIEAVMSLSKTIPINQQRKMTWPWEWNGYEVLMPQFEDVDESAMTECETVYRFRVRGTADLELTWETVQPDGTFDPFYVGLRRAIGLVRLLGDDRNDRDLRLVQGSALDRLLSDRGLKSRIGRQLGTESLRDHLRDEAKTALSDLDAAFEQKALPSNLGVGLAGSPGFSINALIGLTAIKESVALPLTNWGAGTRRLASLAITSFLQDSQPITLIDELERGLEPYRQRSLVKSLINGESQVFITTHSAAALSASAGAMLWHLDANGKIGELPGNKIGKHLVRDPEAFLAKVAVVAEGITEVGFVTVLLEKALGQHPLEFGVWVSDAGGHDTALDILEALSQGGLTFAGIVDNEGRHSGRWDNVKGKMGDLLLQWKQGCLEEMIIDLVDNDRLEDLILDPDDELTGERLRTLAERLEIDSKDFAAIQVKAGDGLKSLIIAAATGHVPEDKRGAGRNVMNPYKGHAKKWFKSREGGHELAHKVVSLGIWTRLQPDVLPFLNAIRTTIGLETLHSLTL
ncbi:MAG: ATP-dependent nuclease [Candidatus Thorarchaeota archaeon]